MTNSFWMCGAFGALLLLVACAGAKPPHAPRLLYSPNGEPVNGGPLGPLACPEALSRWFDRVSNGTGQIDEAVFLADAQAAFARMDLDHDGALYSSELELYRAPYRVGLRPVPAIRGEREKRDRYGRSHEIAVPEASPDPVLSADVNSDLKVTPEEFMAQAKRVFARLDRSHAGALSKDDVLRSCPLE